MNLTKKLQDATRLVQEQIAENITNMVKTDRPIHIKEMVNVCLESIRSELEKKFKDLK